MQYTRKITDQQTGEVFEIKLGEHLTFTEAAKKLKIRRSSFIKVMLNMGICQKEYDPTGKQYRHRLKPEAEQKGLGFRIYGEHGPFDVLSPMAVDWITDELTERLVDSNIDEDTKGAIKALKAFAAQTKEGLDTEGNVRWLLDYYPNLPVTEVGKGLGVSRELVHRYQARRNDQLAYSRRKRSAPLGEALAEFTDETSASSNGVTVEIT
ncbi:hypothetical protein [Emcibacter sp.]|uniref:hypothetical protein n=1 Tax=Emcibacter sp. TaxID=1979954 RepID=UPI003A8FF87B